LRYYERVGLISPVTRNESGIRNYSELDLERDKFIKCMRKAGIPIEVLIDYISLVQLQEIGESDNRPIGKPGIQMTDHCALRKLRLGAI
jgi:DNA-binding transcriptional MerR regulator